MGADADVRHEPHYRGHWVGEAWFTRHSYGEQVHRSEAEARRWLSAQRALGRQYVDETTRLAEYLDVKECRDSEGGW